jgi:dipeptidase E
MIMPKLVFHSDQILPQAEKIERELLAMIGKPNPIFGFIPSSSDTEYRFFHDRQEYYARYGVNLGVYFELDKRYYPEILPALLACDAIHLSGGDTYYFLDWLRKRNLLDTLRQYVEKGGILIGVSAGAILMTPDISTATLAGDTPKDRQMDLTALRLVDFAFIPHLDKVPGGFKTISEFSQSYHLPIYGCRDGDGIIIHDEEMIRLGEVILVENGMVVTDQSE